MTDSNGKVSWQMLGVLAAVFVYTTWGAMQLGAIQQQVIGMAKENSELKMATAALAVQAAQQQQTIAAADVVLRERVARLEVLGFGKLGD